MSRPPRKAAPPKLCPCGKVALYRTDRGPRCKTCRVIPKKLQALLAEQAYLKTRPDLQQLGAAEARDRERDLRTRDRLATLKRGRR